MTYRQVLLRNGLDWQTDDVYGMKSPEHMTPVDWQDAVRNMVAGDLRRLEHDQRDRDHLVRYAALTGVTVAQARKILDLFFEGFPGE